VSVFAGSLLILVFVDNDPAMFVGAFLVLLWLAPVGIALFNGGEAALQPRAHLSSTTRCKVYGLVLGRGNRLPSRSGWGQGYARSWIRYLDNPPQEQFAWEAHCPNPIV
jgi:hypothetical protein